MNPEELEVLKSLVDTIHKIFNTPCNDDVYNWMCENEFVDLAIKARNDGLGILNKYITPIEEKSND